MGVARAGRGRAVAVDVDPNVQKKFQIFCFESGGYPGFSQPAKTAYQSRKSIKHSPVKSTAHVGSPFWPILAHFGPSLTTHRLTARQHATKADTQGPEAAFGPLDVGCISHTAPLS